MQAYVIANSLRRTRKKRRRSKRWRMELVSSSSSSDAQTTSPAIGRGRELVAVVSFSSSCPTTTRLTSTLTLNARVDKTTICLECVRSRSRFQQTKALPYGRRKVKHEEATSNTTMETPASPSIDVNATINIFECDRGSTSAVDMICDA